MGRNRQRLMVLGGLLVLLALVVPRSVWNRQPADGGAASSNASARRASDAGQRGADTSEVVKLEELKAPRPEPVESERNPFRFRPPPAPTPVVSPSAPPPILSTTPPPPPGPPPIALKFIGIIDAPRQGGKMAVLSDGRGHVLHGREGEVVDGRYRILKIGVESIEMAYLDGRGRRTIPLTGQ